MLCFLAYACVASVNQAYIYTLVEVGQTIANALTPGALHVPDELLRPEAPVPFQQVFVSFKIFLF